MSWQTRVMAKADINHYSRKDTNHHIKGSDSAANRRTLVVVPFSAAIDDRLGAGRLDIFTTTADTELDLNTAANWDTVTPTDYTVAAARAGKDFYIYACLQAGTAPKILLSANSTYPSGYTAYNSRKIGGFHCLPYVTAPTWAADTVTALNYVVQPTAPGATKLLYRCTARSGDYKTHAATEPTWPTTVGGTVIDDQVTWTCDANGCENLAALHPYYGYLMGDILFNSIWDLLDRPQCPSPEGMAKLSITPSDGNRATWVDIYLANGTGTTISSVYGATIKRNVAWWTFLDYARLQGKRIITDSEFQKAAYGSNEKTAVAGAADPTVVTFPLDSAGRAMISDIGIIAACGFMWQWLDLQGFRFSAPVAHTHDTVVSGEAQTATSGAASADISPTLAYNAMSSSKGSVYYQGGAGDIKVIAGGAYALTTQNGSHSRSMYYGRDSIDAKVSARFCA